MANILRKQAGILFNRILLLNTIKTYSPCTSNGTFPQHFHTSKNLDKLVSFNLSDIGEGIREVVIKEWYVKEGDKVDQFDNICEVQSDKASVTITSRYDGVIAKIHHGIDEVALVGKPLLDFEIVEDIEDDTSSSSSSSSSTSSESDTEELHSALMDNISRSDGTIVKVLATPAVRRIAMENKVQLSDVKATGKQGRVLKGDILQFLNKSLNDDIKPDSKNGPVYIPVIEKDVVVPIKGVQKAMFKSMTESLKIPHFGYSDEVNLNNLMKLRNDIKEEALANGVKVTFMPFFIKAASLALLKFPKINSVVDEQNETVILKAAHNISIAMDTPQGLVVPNIKNCNQKSVLQIAKELTELIKLGQSNSLKPEHFANGTFSLSNIGIIGGTYLHPCVMSPQVAIGAVGQVKAVPQFDENDKIIKAHIMNVSWTADHRILDGVTVAQFSNLWKKYLENPSLFLLSGI